MSVPILFQKLLEKKQRSMRTSNASGDYAAIMDVDLQDPPSLPDMR